MTLREIIEKVDQTMPNAMPLVEKLGHITQIDGLISTIILKQTTSISPYTMLDMDKEGIIPFPFTDIYEHYLMAMIDVRNEEFELYGNHKLLYDAAYERFVKHIKQLEVRIPTYITGVE